jgi:hypothetical protein
MGFGDWLIQLGMALGGHPPSSDDYPHPPTGPRLEIAGNELREVLRTALGSEGDIYLADHNFWLCELEDIERFLDWDETSHHNYAAEEYDCDDFAKRLWGQLAIPGWSHFAFGLVWTDVHAMNILVDTNRDVWFIEPQTDARRSSLLSWQGNVLRWLVV